MEFERYICLASMEMSHTATCTAACFAKERINFLNILR